MSYNFETLINFEAVGSNLQVQDLYTLHIHLKPIIFLHHTEIYFKSTPVSTLQCNTIISTSCSVSFAPNELCLPPSEVLL